MDDLQLLRETRNDLGTVPPAVLARGRDRVMKLAAAEDATGEQKSVRTLPVRRPWRRALLATAAAAAIAASFMAADVVGTGDRRGSTAEAAEALSDAATATIATSDPVVGPGQYLLVDTKGAHSSANLATPGETYTWLASQNKQLYLPADRSEEWILVRDPSVPVQFFDEASRKFVEQQQAELEDPARGPIATTPYTSQLMRAPGGNFYGDEQAIFNNMPLGEALDTAPRDPQALLELIYQRNAGKGATPEEQAFKTIAEALGTGVIPADLRAALYEAAALMPGVTVLDRQATLDGRTGISIGMDKAEHLARVEMIIDPDSGLLIGEREVLLEDWAGMPAGATPVWTAVTTSVVDAAP